MLVDLKSRNGSYVNGKRIETRCCKHRGRGPRWARRSSRTRSTTSGLGSPDRTDTGGLPARDPAVPPACAIACPTPSCAKVLAPPYDVIPPAYQARAVRARPAQHRARRPQPHAGDAAYDEAGADLPGLRMAADLLADAEPALYLVEQAFEPRTGRTSAAPASRASGSRSNARGACCPTSTRARQPRRTAAQAPQGHPRELQPHLHDVLRRPGRLRETGHSGGRRPRPDFQYTDDGGVQHRVWSIRDGATVSALQSAIGSGEGVHRGRPSPLGHRPAVSRRKSARKRPGPSATSRRWRRRGLVVLPVPPPPGPRSVGRGGAPRP